MCKNVCGAGKLLRIWIAENVELYGMGWYSVNIIVSDKSAICVDKHK